MTDDEIALALQIALLGEVSAAMRGNSFMRRGNDVTLRFYFDGPVSEMDRESASCVETELIAALPAQAKVRTEIVRADAPAALPESGRWSYRRREPDAD